MARDDLHLSDFDHLPANSDERRIRIQVSKTAEFYKHLCIYVLVMGGLTALCVAQVGLSPKRGLWSYWVIWPAMGWGIGLFFHGLSVAPALGRWGAEWEERRVQEILAREAKRSRGP
jgi:hypothetical protein